MTAPFLSRWDPQGAASARENSLAAARVLDSNFKQPRTIRCRAVIPIEIVIAGLDPVIHPLRRKLLRRGMDARIKSGHDERVWRNWQLLRADSDFISATALFADTTSRSRDAPESLHLSFAPEKWRAWGMPGARCTRSLVRTL
jgi:hypothetical protein